MVRARKVKQPRPFARLATIAVAFLLFTASAFFYAQDSKTVPAAPVQLPIIPGIQLPTDKLPDGQDSGRETLPAPSPATGRKGLPSPDLLPPAVMKPARPDAVAPADRANFDGGIIQATYRELSGRRDLVFTAQDKGAFAKPIGTLNWDIADKQIVNGGLDPQFRTYCCEPLISVTPGQTYKFKFDPIDRPEYFNQADDEQGREATIQRTRFIRELYGKYYTESVSDKENAAAAFQVALWELVSESSPNAEQEKKFSLFNGTFRTTFDQADAAPEYVRMGEKYLKSLTGDDRVFFENPTFDNLELVRLTGLPGDDNSLPPQSQFTLRPRTDFAGGAGGGLANASALGNSSPLLMASGGTGGSPLLGSGAGLGGGGGFPATGGFGGGSGSSTGGSGSGSGTGTGTGTGTGGTGGISTGGGGGGTGGGGTGGTGGGGGGTGGGGGGGVPITPVPAPPAVLLALAGVGVLAGGRIFRGKKA